MKGLSRREFVVASGALLSSFMFKDALANPLVSNKKRIGIIGLDTSHAIAFTKSINSNPKDFRGYKVTTAYPFGTKTIPSATERIPKYTQDIKEYDVRISKSIDSLLKQVDVVLLETNDGRLHLEQAEQVLKKRIPLFIDKPLAASYKDAKKIFELSEKYNTPFFSSSSLRYIDGMKEILEGKYGKVLGADVYSPAALEPTHPDFFWYGIHGVEMLFAAMGIGCQSVSRTHTADTDVIVGTWEDGRVGTVRGTRNGEAEFGGVVFCEKGAIRLGEFKGYEPLLKEIVLFFDTKEVPFDTKQTLEICAFIEAADESKNNLGASVHLSSITGQ